MKIRKGKYLLKRGKMYEDRTLICKECGQEFIFTAEQEFMLSAVPERASALQPCRDARKNAARAPREYFSYLCACGTEAKVPFEPKSDRPVYCSDFARMRQQRD